MLLNQTQALTTGCYCSPKSTQRNFKEKQILNERRKCHCTKKFWNELAFFPPRAMFFKKCNRKLIKLNWHFFKTSKHFEDVLITVGCFCGFIMCSLKMQIRVDVCMGPELVTVSI